MTIATTSDTPVVANLADMANAIRVLAMDAVEKAASGHPGMPMGMADVATVLFSRFLKFDPAEPEWPDRDRFVLSAGHGSMLLYALLHLTGYPGMTAAELARFRQWGALTAGHPEYGHTPGVETTTGPLGAGIATAVGMALAEEMQRARFGRGFADHHTYVIAGDGCLMEGISHEAISLAGHLRLSRLIVLFDDNGISIDGAVTLSCSDDQLARFRASNWSVEAIDGHDLAAIEAALVRARAGDRPSLIACRTVIGRGAPTKAGSAATHGAPLGAEEIAATREAFGWQAPPFVVPDHIKAAWAQVGRRGQAARAAWGRRLSSAPEAQRHAFLDSLSPLVPQAAFEALHLLRASFIAAGTKIATRQASQRAIAALLPVMPTLAGGSADLTHSNLTQGHGQPAVQPRDFAGSYIHFGIREHAMVSALNGMALHGGFVPYGGTFLVFADYCRPAIRLAALMGLRVILVMTHDSIGLGEDGPTHQPVEHLAAYRAIPNLLVLRPADAAETAECWAIALAEERRPSLLALSRQALPCLPHDPALSKAARGAYVLREAAGDRQLTLMASGSEVAIVLEAADALAAEGLRVAVVSIPCFERFAEQPAEYRAEVLGNAPRIGVEAAIESVEWRRLLGDGGIFIGMTSFGASAPAGVLYQEFGITAGAVIAAARRLVGGA
ncbi:transketolase [Zavarzinia compransoris]|uniref:Transketolase n=1 Tax=Zavarzinia compransoris TaxID=1264899 RepID=A0A317E863_9PROT|nr:transketolase [Zavarzinia compransoris]PWR23129.1 transketolase [Zavarzinia compransoris]TDP46316.1 transketolase [Zavarzinia compransoris]